MLVNESPFHPAQYLKSGVTSPAIGLLENILWCGCGDYGNVVYEDYDNRNTSKEQYKRLNNGKDDVMMIPKAPKLI